MNCQDCGLPLSGPGTPDCWYPTGTHGASDDEYIVFEGYIAGGPDDPEEA